MKKRLTRVATAAAVLALGLGPAAPAHAAPTTDIKPASLDKGDSGYVPHVVGSDLVVAGTHYPFDGHVVLFLGYTGEQLNEYVVGIYVQGKPRSNKVVVVPPDDDRRVVLEGVSVPEISLSADGEQLLRPTYRDRTRTTTVRVWSVDDGSLTNTRRFRGYVEPLDAFEGRAVLSGSMPERTFWWDTADGSTSRISSRHGYEASIRQNRLAVLTGDPYQGGCSVVSTLTDPSTRLWRSCQQAVHSFSPSGDRVVTTYLLADGLGPGEYQLRETTGALVRSFRTYFFQEVWWEADEVLLLHAFGKEKNAWVRCTDQGDCERTSRLRDTDL